MRLILAIILFLAGVIFFALPAFAGELNLTWTAPTDPCVGSFKVYYGTVSHQYTNSVAVGFETTATLSNLCSGVMYYFAATAFTTNGLESDFSNEIATALKPDAPNLNSSSVTIYFGPFTVRQSPDLTNWSTNLVPGFFTVPIGASDNFFQIALPGNGTFIPSKITLSP